MSANDSSISATAKLSTPPDADTAPTSSSHSSSDSPADAADIQARIEQKRHEHEQQRAMQRKVFEQQMALLEKQQREEEQNLLLQRNPNSATAAAAAAAVASAPTTPPNESAIANPKSSSAAATTAATAGANTTDAAARANALAHLYRSMPSSRRQSGETQRETDDIAAAVAAISIGGPAKSDDDSAAKPNDKAAAADNLTPVFNERFLFDDELDNEDSAFLDATTQLEELQGDIFALCKDQHGCRFLQKKLEESNGAHRDMIFSETFSHFAELMTDPFGNYLCQKMLEYCTDEQRNLIVELVAPELVTISLNMHGTRAVQKMIDFLSTPRQIHSIIVALSMNVVTLIKDLNGNHVVQKCLNRLGAEDNQFIYNAVAAHCVEVATHRHGCCVLQRCIDHASESQRVQLVAEITYNALTLVQDPFGNYVVQYVLDLSIARFTDAVVRQFVGNVCLLSVQKFSSNVMEKCIRVSEPGVRKQLIEELLNRARLEKLLRDSYANYVVQTSLDYADPVQRMRLVECIRPILPVIRNTPYGKRIQSKLQRDNLDLGPPNGVPYSVLAAHQQQMHMGGAGGYRGGGGGYMGMNAYPGPGQGGMPPHMHPHAPQHVYGAPGGSPHMRPPPAGGGHNLPPPHFGQATYGFNANLPPPMGMQHAASRGTGSGPYNNTGFGNY
ncbi:translational repressor MPT5/PUF4 and related RNA-binding proteins [Moesziomyces antarcticus T-34]|uniref:Translational repressor MPT5/PUF4 and related RNA-binding proteins n=1 Tax=Pseudozyma antarctica (strain T-34) TaxID=1151754 RepID=M9LUT9_PSEA3|nr:translational repressor MPT5/PUF4 and related RNA-binding proteins [Moesziomyces antarcticus T-34]